MITNKKRISYIFVFLIFVFISILPALRVKATTSAFAEDSLWNDKATNYAYVGVELNAEYFGGKWWASSVSYFVYGLARESPGFFWGIPVTWKGQMFTMQTKLWINNELLFSETKQFFPGLENGGYTIDKTFTDLDISGHILDAYVT